MSLSDKNTFIKKGISLLAITLFFTAATLSAQTANKITLNKERVTLSEIFSVIENQTNSVVVVNPNRTNINKEVVLNRTSGTIAEILSAALSGTGQTYQTNGRYIVITPAENQEKTPTPKNTSTDNTGNVLSYNRQPVQAEPDRGVSNYSNRNLNVTNTPQSGSVRNGNIFNYPDNHAQIVNTQHDITRGGQPYLLDTPPSFAIKTNLLYWATATPNIAIEFGLREKTSLDIMAGYNPWDLEGTYESNKKMVHWIIRPEFRYWFCERFNGHFLGVHAFYLQYNIGGYDLLSVFDKEYRYQGNAFGAGLSYGYHLPLSKHWGLEFNLGAGVAFLDYTKKDCVKCGHEVGKYQETYFGPTNAGIKLLYLIK